MLTNCRTSTTPWAVSALPTLAHPCFEDDPMQREIPSPPSKRPAFLAGMTWQVQQRDLQINKYQELVQRINLRKNMGRKTSIANDDSHVPTPILPLFFAPRLLFEQFSLTTMHLYFGCLTKKFFFFFFPPLHSPLHQCTSLRLGDILPITTRCQ